MTEKKEFGWGDLIYVFLLSIMFIMMLVGMVSCGASKKSQSTVITKTDSLFIHDTMSKTTTDTVHVTKKETEVRVVTNVMFDTVKEECPKNKITYKVNGDVELEGTIKEFNQDRSDWYKKLDSASKHAEAEHKSRLFWQSQAEQLKAETFKKKGIPAIIWISWTLSFIIALVCGVYIGVRFRNFFV